MVKIKEGAKILYSNTKWLLKHIKWQVQGTVSCHFGGKKMEECRKKSVTLIICREDTSGYRTEPLVLFKVWITWIYYLPWCTTGDLSPDWHPQLWGLLNSCGTTLVCCIHLEFLCERHTWEDVLDACYNPDSHLVLRVFLLLIWYFPLPSKCEKTKL